MSKEKRRRLPRVRSAQPVEQAQQDVDHELSFHIERLVEANMRKGMDEQAARAAALQRFGDVGGARATLTKQTAARERNLRKAEFLNDLKQDVRYAARTLARNPVFAFAAVATLALGIGANTAIFGVAHGILFERLPYAAPERLVMLWQNNMLAGDERYPFSPANYRDLIERTKTLDGVAAYAPQSEVTVMIGKTAERARSALVSREFFDVAGVQPALGRKFEAAEAVMGGPRVAVISDAYWRRRFARDRGVLGQSILLYGMPLTIVGVMPPGFTVPTADEVDIVSAIQYAPDYWTVRARHSMRLIARLRDGVTVEQARREANNVFAELEGTYPETNRGMRVTLLDLRTALVGDVRTMLLVLLGAVSLVLLVACANITNLLLARASERVREFSIRSSLGAGRARIMRQLLTESAVLALVGAGAGLVLAHFLIGGIRSLGAASLPLLNRVDLSRPVLLFALAITVLTALLVGTLPALQGMRARAAALREEARGSSAGRSRQRTRRALVVAQVALSIVLLVGAGLLIRSYRAIMSIDPGFTTESVLTFTLMKMANQEERLRFFDEVERRLSALPGVTRVGAVSMLPLTGAGGRAEAHVIGESSGERKPPELRWRSVTAGYFDVMDLRLRRGRLFDTRDVSAQDQRLVLNEEAAARVFGTRDPIGHRVRLGPDSTTEPWTVIGVVENARNEALTEGVQPEVFAFNAQVASGMMTLALRTAVDPTSVLPGARAVVAELDPTIVLADVRTTRELIDASVAKPRFIMMLLGGFAALGLILAVVGTYGVFAYFVAQRQREIGIRMALGADSSTVLRWIGGEGVKLAFYGAGIGLVIAFFAARVLESMLFQVQVSDPISYGGTVVIVLLTAILATGVPALRAARLNPGSIMRGD